MTSNPYATPTEVQEPKLDSSWYRRSLSALANRFSMLYVAGSIAGVVAGVSYRAGVRNAINDIATFNGVVFFSFFALLATIASVTYCPNHLHPKARFGRLFGGFSFGLLCLLVEPYVNHLNRSYPDWITPGLGFVLTLVASFCVAVVVQMVFKLGSESSAQLSDLPNCG